MRWLRRFKQRLVNWLLRDVVVERLKVRYVIVGDPAKLLSDGTVVFAPLTSNPSTLEAGKLWYRSDLDAWYYSPDGTTAKQLGGGYPPDNTYICLDANSNLTICDDSVDYSKVNILIGYLWRKVTTFPSTTDGGATITNSSYAVDLDTTTYAYATVSSDSVTIDLGSNLEWYMYIKIGLATSGASAYPTHHTVEISSDGSTWSQILDIYNRWVAHPTGTVKGFYTCRYIRFRIWFEGSFGGGTAEWYEVVIGKIAPKLHTYW